MRAATAGEIAALQAEHRATDLEVHLENGVGVFQDLTDTEGRNWVVAAEWGATVDEPGSTATIAVRREAFGVSLSPFVEDSPVNHPGGGAYAPLVDTRREIRLETETRERGEAPGSLTMRPVFEGVVETPETASGGNISLACHDKWAALVAAQIEEPRDYGSDAGTLVHLVIQQMLDDTLGVGVVTLHAPTPPAFAVTPYRQEAGSLGEAIRGLAMLPGWDLRYLWSETLGEYVLTLYEPDRVASTALHTFTPSEYLKVNGFRINPANVRNRIRVSYTDAATGKQEFVEVEDAASIAKYGLQFMHLREQNSPIDTAAEATTMATAALSDLADPLAEMEVELLYWWRAELGDLYTFQAGPGTRHFDADQTLAVVGYRNTLSRERRRTILTLRGRPAGAYSAWLRREVQLAGENASDPEAFAVTDLEFRGSVGGVRTYRVRMGTAVTEAHVHFAFFSGSVPADYIDQVYLIENLQYVLTADGDEFTVNEPIVGEFLRGVVIPRVALGDGSLVPSGQGWEFQVDGSEPPIVPDDPTFTESGDGTASVVSLGILDPRGVVTGVSVFLIEVGVESGPFAMLLAAGTYSYGFSLHPDHAVLVRLRINRSDGGDPIWLGPYSADTDKVPSIPDVRRARLDAEETLLVDAPDTDTVSLWYREEIAGVPGSEVAIAPRGVDPRFGSFVVTAANAERTFRVYGKNSAGVVGEYRLVVVEPANATILDAQATPDGNGTANVLAIFSPTTAVGASEAQYRVDGGTPVALTVAADRTATWTVAQDTLAEQLVEIQAQNTTGEWGPWFPLIIPIFIPAPPRIAFVNIEKTFDGDCLTPADMEITAFFDGYPTTSSSHDLNIDLFIDGVLISTDNRSPLDFSTTPDREWVVMVPGYEYSAGGPQIAVQVQLRIEEGATTVASAFSNILNLGAIDCIP